MKTVSLSFSKWSLRRCFAWIFLLLIFTVPLAYSEWVYFPFVASKWIVFYWTAIFASVYLLFCPSVAGPKGALLKTTLILLALKILSVTLAPHLYSLHSLFNALVIGILCLALLNMFREKDLSLADFYGPLVVSTSVLLGFAWVQYYFHRWIGRAEDPQFFSTLFGNINYSSQYFVMLVPLFAYFVQTKRGWQQAVSGFLLTNVIFFTFAGLSRSSVIGVCLWFLYRLWTKISRAELACVLIAGLMFAGHRSLETREHFYAQAKEGSFVKRSELYRGSLRMLWDYPFGIGGEAFEYGYVPYQLATQEAPTPEEMYITPHSEFLKWGIENGWGYLITTLFWFGFFLWALIRSDLKKDDRILLVSLLVAVAADITFQFPFDNPATLILFCVYFGYALSLLPNGTLRLEKFRWLLWTPVTLVLIANASAYTISKYNEGSHLNDLDEATLGCDLYPVNYRICFYGAARLAPRFALPYIIMELRQRPFNYSHLRLFAATLDIGLKEKKDACELQSLYLQIFPKQTPFLSCESSGLAPRIPYDNPTQFRDDFTKRLNVLLDKYSSH